MEGLYVRSRQENDKAFRQWLREKRQQAEVEREMQWRQVQVLNSISYIAYSSLPVNYWVFKLSL